MPHAVTHVLIALIIGSLIRDFFVKDKKKFPLHYVLIIGIGGLLPDIDVVLYWILYWFGFSLQEVHRTFSHNFFFLGAFLLISLFTLKLKNKELGKHHLKTHMIFLMLALGIFIHLILDAIFSGYVMPLWPLSDFAIGINLINYLPYPLNDIFFPSLDAALLVLWLIYIEWRHKISDFI